MRTYGRARQADGSYKWVKVVTTPAGLDDFVWITTLIQCLKLNLGESPFWSDYGIPARQAIVQQIFPDYYVAVTQQRFASRFASLMMSRKATDPPTYQINLTTHEGVKLSTVVEIPG